MVLNLTDLKRYMEVAIMNVLDHKNLVIIFLWIANIIIIRIYIIVKLIPDALGSRCAVFCREQTAEVISFSYGISCLNLNCVFSSQVIISILL